MIRQSTSGWELSGVLEVQNDVTAALNYLIVCDTEWRTRSAVVTGAADGANVRFELVSDGTGEWIVNGSPMPALAGTIDLDLGFTPATNVLPIRRLSLAIGESAFVESAWLRFPELRLERLEQTYTREGAQTFGYLAMVDGEPFSARLDTDRSGRVLCYEGLWEIEKSSA